MVIMDNYNWNLICFSIIYLVLKNTYLINMNKTAWIAWNYVMIQINGIVELVSINAMKKGDELQQNINDNWEKCNWLQKVVILCLINKVLKVDWICFSFLFFVFHKLSLIIDPCILFHIDANVIFYVLTAHFMLNI